MNRKWLIPGIIGGVILVLLLTIGGAYNGLVSSRENVNRSLGDIQAQYQRRSDLVPNLVSTVKGAAEFEQETFTQVTEARAKATSISIDPSQATPQQLAEFQNAQGELSQALGRLLAVSENYPQLRATDAFRDLQSQLEGTENRIAVARRDYNAAAATYNVRTQRFPTNIVAGLFGFDRSPPFQADTDAQDAPSVNFGQ